MENTILSTSTLTKEHEAAHAAAEQDPLEALATRVFFYTLGYVVIFMAAAVMLVA